MNDYEESFYYDKTTSVGSDVSGEALGLGLGLGVGLIATIMSGILFLIGRMDILNALLVTLVSYILTYRYKWNMPIYILGAVIVFGISMLLQHRCKFFRIIFGLFTCIVVGLLVLVFKGYDTEKEMYVLFGIGFAITILLEFISWKFYIKNK